MIGGGGKVKKIIIILGFCFGISNFINGFAKFDEYCSMQLVAFMKTEAKIVGTIDIANDGTTLDRSSLMSRMGELCELHRLNCYRAFLSKSTTEVYFSTNDNAYLDGLVLIDGKLKTSSDIYKIDNGELSLYNPIKDDTLAIYSFKEYGTSKYGIYGMYIVTSNSDSAYNELQELGALLRTEFNTSGITTGGYNTGHSEEERNSFNIEKHSLSILFGLLIVMCTTVYIRSISKKLQLQKLEGRSIAYIFIGEVLMVSVKAALAAIMAQMIAWFIFVEASFSNCYKLLEFLVKPTALFFICIVSLSFIPLLSVYAVSTNLIVKGKNNMKFLNYINLSLKTIIIILVSGTVYSGFQQLFATYPWLANNKNYREATENIFLLSGRVDEIEDVDIRNNQDQLIFDHIVENNHAYYKSIGFYEDDIFSAPYIDFAFLVNNQIKIHGDIESLSNDSSAILIFVPDSLMDIGETIILEKFDYLKYIEHQIIYYEDQNILNVDAGTSNETYNKPAILFLDKDKQKSINGVYFHFDGSANEASLYLSQLSMDFGFTSKFNIMPVYSYYKVLFDSNIKEAMKCLPTFTLAMLVLILNSIQTTIFEFIKNARKYRIDIFDGKSRTQICFESIINHFLLLIICELLIVAVMSVDIIVISTISLLCLLIDIGVISIVYTLKMRGVWDI